MTEEYVEAFITECRENLDRIEADLGALARGEAALSPEMLSRVFQAFHSIKGAASYLSHDPLRQLGQLTERLLVEVRKGNIDLSTACVEALLDAAGRMRQMVRDGHLQFDVLYAIQLENLYSILRTHPKPAKSKAKSSFLRDTPPSGQLKILVVEDDFSCRVLLQGLLSKYGECHIAVNGKEAVSAFRSAWDQGQSYDLICMDIQMPEMGGQEAISQIRAIETAAACFANRTKVFVTTSIQDMKTIISSFKALCDAYLFKPVRGSELEDHLRSFNLIAAPPAPIAVQERIEHR